MQSSRTLLCEPKFKEGGLTQLSVRVRCQMPATHPDYSLLGLRALIGRPPHSRPPWYASGRFVCLFSRMLALQSKKMLDFRARGPRVARSQRRPFRPPLVWSHLLALLVVGYHCACVLWCESEREGVGIAPLRSCAPAYPQGASWRIRTPWNVAGTYQGAPGSSSEAPGSLREPQRALESPWKALESSGELWKALRSFGKPTYNMAQIAGIRAAVRG